MKTYLKLFTILLTSILFIGCPTTLEPEFQPSEGNPVTKNNKEVQKEVKTEVQKEAKINTDFQFGANLQPEDASLTNSHNTNRVFNGIEYSGNHNITFYPSGIVASGKLAKNANVNGKNYQSGTLIKLYEHGIVASGRLSRIQTIGGVTYSSTGDITFYPNGQVKSGRLSPNGDPSIGGIRYKGGHYYPISFHFNGQVKSATLLNETTINGVAFQGNRRIEFYYNGEVKSGSIARHTEINGVVYSSGNVFNYESDSTEPSISYSVIDGIVYETNYYVVPKGYPQLAGTSIIRNPRLNEISSNNNNVNYDYTVKIIANIWLPRDLSGQDLSGQDLSGQDLSGANLSNADLRNANLTNANLDNANLTNTYLTGEGYLYLRSIGIDGFAPNLRNANLSYANLENANLREANLRNANLRNANLLGAHLRNANLSNANLSNADLRSASLSNADLQGANFTNASTNGANLTGVRNADFSGAIP